VNIGGNAVATNGTSDGVHANHNATITVDGDVTGGTTGVKSVGSIVTVGGDVTVNSGVGVYAEDDSEVTIDGVITVPAGVTYIEIDTAVYGFGDNTVPSTKTGYREYTDGISYVWVKIITGSGNGTQFGGATIVDPTPVQRAPVVSNNNETQEEEAGYSAEEEPKDEPAAAGKSNTWLWLLLLLLLAVIIGLYLSRKKIQALLKK